MLRLNAFLLVGGLAAFVAGSAAGFKVLTISDDKPEYPSATVTSAQAAPRPASVIAPKVEDDAPPPVSAKPDEATAPSPPLPAATPPPPVRIAESKSERSDAPEAAPTPAASPKKAGPGKPSAPKFVPKPRSRGDDDDDDDDDC